MARIRHIAILTDHKEKLVEYYTSVFGLKVVKGVGTATYLSDGHVNLAIIPKGPEEEVEGHPLDSGLNHIGFEVDDAQAVKPLSDRHGRGRRRPEAAAEPRIGVPGTGPGRQPDRPVTAWVAGLRVVFEMASFDFASLRSGRTERDRFHNRSS